MKKLLFVFGLLFVLIGCQKPSQPATTEETEPKAQETPKVEKKVYYSPYRGEEVPKEALTQPAYGVMLDNHEDARPQGGISQGDLLMEMKVEGDYTRYFCLFQQEYPPVVGPVRSARPYFIEEALGLGAIYVHSGASEAG